MPTWAVVKRGSFVTFEGGEGAGKSTAISSAAAALRERGCSVLVTREPGSGEFGAKIRAMLLESEEVTPRVELFLFLADRAYHCRNVLEPALARGDIVLCDRYADSTLVYQGLVRGLDESFVRAANAFATNGLLPDLTLLLDVPAEVGLARLRKKNRLDREPVEFHRRVREGFLRLAGEEPDRWRIIDASQKPTAVLACVLAEIRPS
jgi:dTMP kinase